MKHTEGKAELRKRLHGLSKKFINERGDTRYRERIFIQLASGNYIEVVSLNKTEARANAERIVKAWNNHDDLVSALQALQKWVVNKTKAFPPELMDAKLTLKNAE